MAVLVEVRVPASEFVLAETLTTFPDVRIEIKRVVAGDDRVTPYFWVFGNDLEAFERALHDDSDTLEVLMLEEDQPNERFFRVVWHHDVPNILTSISNAKATILEAVNDEGGEWELKILLPSYDALSQCQEYCHAHDISFDLLRVYQPENPPERAHYGLTEAQQEALEAAFEHGYFDVPREETLTEIAEQLGISRNALSARIRRGHRNMLANTLIHGT